MELGYRGDPTVRATRLRSLFFLPAALPRATMAWQPQVDIYRSRDGWIVKLELAGVRPQDISIAAHGSRLHVEGVRHDWIMEPGWSHHTMEIAYNRFERIIELPCDLAQAHITVECRDGMLLLRVAT